MVIEGSELFGDGSDAATFEGFGLDDILSFTLSGDFWSVALDNVSEAVSGLFRNLEYRRFGGSYYTTAVVLWATGARVPLPAGAVLLGTALGLLALRRRRASI